MKAVSQRPFFCEKFPKKKSLVENKYTNLFPKKMHPKMKKVH